MRAVGLLTRSALRRQWRSVVAIALIAGLGGGFALTAAAGTRRASNAWERLRRATLAPDVLIQAREGTDPSLIDSMRRQPAVSAAGNFVFTPVAPEPAVPGVDAGAFIAMDPYFGYDVYRPIIEDGRRPSRHRADEVTVNRPLADLAHIKVGQRVRLRSGFDPAQLTALGEVTVVGIHKGTFDVGANAGGPSVLLGHAFLNTHREKLTLSPEPGGAIRLRDGLRGTQRALRQVGEIWGDAAVVLPSGDEEPVVVDAVNVQVIALALLALAAGVATAVAAGQALGRLVAAAQPDTAVLRALGLRRRDIVSVGIALAALVALIATGLAVVIAVAASSLLPTGLAATIEPDPGIRIDGLALAGGAAMIIAFLVAVGALLAWRAARRDVSPTRASARPVPALSPAAAIGVHWTIASTPGPAAAAARSALAAAATGVAGVVAVVTFAASLSHFLATDRLYGWEFQAGYVGEPADPAEFADAVDALAAAPAITGVARGDVVRLDIGGEQMEAWALEAVKGVAHPTLLTGRAPAGADEIVVGGETLSRLGLSVGSSVDVAGPDGHRVFRVVGTAVFPELGNTGDLANNAWITAHGQRGLGGEPALSVALVGGSPRARVYQLIEDNSPSGMENILSFQPPRVRNIKQVGSAPWLLAGFFSLLALAAVAHSLFLSVRHRRRELAVLRSLGMLRGQIHAAVTAQAGTTVVAGALIGVPVGIAAGRLTWGAIASGLAVLNRPVVNFPAIAAVVAGAWVVAIAAALVPAIRAGRLHPAAVLRTE